MEGAEEMCDLVGIAKLKGENVVLYGENDQAMHEEMVAGSRSIANEL